MIIVYKAILLLIFAAALVSLFSGLVFLVRGNKSKKTLTANALLVRVCLCILLIILVIFGMYNGYINPSSPLNLL